MGRGARLLGRLAVNEALGFCDDRVIAPVFDPTIDLMVGTRDAWRGGRDAHKGLMGIATLETPRRGDRFTEAPRSHGAGATRIAGEWFHGTADRRDALWAIDTTASALSRDLATVPAALQAWATGSARAELDAWGLFRDQLLASTSALLATRWDVIDEWRTRIMDLRDLTAVAGGVVTAPVVPELPRTLWERAEHGGGDTFDRWLTIARGSAYAILAVTGVWGMITAVRSLRRVKIVERELEAEGEGGDEGNEHEHEHPDTVE